MTTDPLRPATGVIVFQYNPETLTRTLTARTAGDQSGTGPPRFAGLAEQTLKLAVELDATDQLEQGDPLTRAVGIAPALARLELLVQPAAATVIANEALLRAGVVEILPAEAPLTVLVWGAQRILPVRVTELSVTEDAFDTTLNPIRAKVDLGLKVVNHPDVPMLSEAGALSMAAHVGREVLAGLGW
ncbi:hypothetical protein AB0D34_06475 [Streptomyces sp. NPDC048420]|uniref:CIS tube protein n=1 Tax=Streptomyces sp. NPDC048420 TaxID=3155755 RepID=UPI003415B409